MAHLNDVADSDRASANARSRFDPNCKFCGEPIDWCEPSIAAMGAGANIKTFPVTPGTFESHASVCVAQPNKHPKKVWTNPHYKLPDVLEMQKRLESQQIGYRDQLLQLESKEAAYIHEIARLKNTIKAGPTTTNVSLPASVIASIQSDLESIRARLKIGRLKGGKRQKFQTIASTSPDREVTTKKSHPMKGKRVAWKHSTDEVVSANGKILRSPKRKAEILTAYAIGQSIESIKSKYKVTLAVFHRFVGFKEASKARRDIQQRVMRPVIARKSTTARHASGHRAKLDIAAVISARKEGKTLKQISKIVGYASSAFYSYPEFREAFPRRYFSKHNPRPS